MTVIDDVTLTKPAPATSSDAAKRTTLSLYDDLDQIDWRDDYAFNVEESFEHSIHIVWAWGIGHEIRCPLFASASMGIYPHLCCDVAMLRVDEFAIPVSKQVADHTHHRQTTDNGTQEIGHNINVDIKQLRPSYCLTRAWTVNNTHEYWNVGN